MAERSGKIESVPKCDSTQNQVRCGQVVYSDDLVGVLNFQMGTGFDRSNVAELAAMMILATKKLRNFTNFFGIFGDFWKGKNHCHARCTRFY